MYEVPEYGAPRMARGSGSLAQPLSSLRPAPTSFPTPVTPSVGGNAVNPYVMAAGGVMDGLGKLGEMEMKKREYQLGKQQQYQNQYMNFTNAINDQRQRAARTPGLEALMTQMAQRLGVNLPMQRAKELEIKPVSGNYGVDKTFADQYGGQYADDYARNLAAGAKPKAAAPRMSPTMSLMQNMLMGMGRRNA